MLSQRQIVDPVLKTFFKDSLTGINDVYEALPTSSSSSSSLTSPSSPPLSSTDSFAILQSTIDPSPSAINLDHHNNTIIILGPNLTLNEDTNYRIIYDTINQSQSQPPPLLTSYTNNNYRHYVELSPLLPFGMMLIISTIIFILIIFRRWPGLVAGIVAGCLTSISIYLLLLTLKEQRLVYE